jgi:hypothetical protein
MELRREVIGANPGFVLKDIPRVSGKDKTIFINDLGVISIFRDRRPEATKWITEVLPTMWIGRAEEILAVFWNSPENTWFEFDTGRKTLSICSLEKKVPK